MVRGAGSSRVWKDRLARVAESRSAGQVLAGLLAVSGLLAPVAVTGYRLSDRVLAAGIVALAGLAGTRAPRWTWLVLAGAAGAVAGSGIALAVAFVAVVLGIVAAWYRRPLPALGAAVCGAGMLALLQARGLDEPWGTPLLTPAVGLVAAAPALIGGLRHARPATRKRVLLGGVVAAVLAGAVTGGFALAAKDARASADSGVSSVSAARRALAAGDLPTARAQLEAADRELAKADQRLNAPWSRAAGALPFVGPNASAATEMVRVARRLSTQVRGVLEGGVDDLQFTGGRVDVAALEDLRVPVAELLATTTSGLETAESARSPWLLPPLDRALDDAIEDLRATRDGADLAGDTLSVMPDILGGDGRRRYLVLFVTPVEARATGFPGNFAEIVTRDGKLSMTRFGRTSTDLILDRPARLDLPAPFLERYHAFGIESTWSAVTASPDFPRVAEAAAQLYEQSRGGRAVDGVLTIDPSGLAALLDLTGPVQLPGVDRALTSANAEQFLLRDQYRLDDGSQRRVDLLESLGKKTFQRLTQGDFKARDLLAPALLEAGRQGHIRMVSFEPEERRLLHRIGLDHPLPSPGEGDALAVVTSNAISGKIDAFLHRELDYAVDWDPETGEVRATLEVTLRNDTPSTGLPSYVTTNALSGPLGDDYAIGTNRMILSVYTPWEATSITLDGKRTRRDNEIEAGYQIYDTEIVLPPDGGSAVLRLELEGYVAPGASYALSVWNQVLAHPDELRFRLTEDAETVLDESLTLDSSQRLAYDAE